MVASVLHWGLAQSHFLGYDPCASTMSRAVCTAPEPSVIAGTALVQSPSFTRTALPASNTHLGNHCNLSLCVMLSWLLDVSFASFGFHNLLNTEQQANLCPAAPVPAYCSPF